MYCVPVIVAARDFPQRLLAAERLDVFRQDLIDRRQRRLRRRRPVRAPGNTGMAAGIGRPLWQVLQVTTCLPPNWRVLMSFIMTIICARHFLRRLDVLLPLALDVAVDAVEADGALHQVHRLVQLVGGRARGAL